MELQLTRPIIKVGNSAGVLLPKEWLNGEAKVKLIEKPPDIKADILKILTPFLDKILGVYIIGSYARGEEKKDSDVDVLVITEDINSKILKGKYEIILISKQQLEYQLKSNIIPILPMLREAKPIINSGLLLQYKNSKLTKKNLRFHIQTTKSAMSIVKEVFKIGYEKISDNIMYSLILRLREVYIIECLQNNKIPTTHELLKIIKKLTGNEEAYYAYKRAKDKPSRLKKISLESAEKIYEYIKHKISEQEKWAERGKKSS